jgi:hypothetical protein
LKYFLITVVFCFFLKASAGNLDVQPRVDEDKKLYGVIHSDYVFTCQASGDNENTPKALQ